MTGTIDPPDPSDTAVHDGWRVLVVDGDPEVHHLVRRVLDGLCLDALPFTVLHAATTAEAERMLTAESGIPVVVVNVQMASREAGLDLIRWIRDDLGNGQIRIILNGPPPVSGPELTRDFDIHDYRSVAEMTSEAFLTALVTAVRTWRGMDAVNAKAKFIAGEKAVLEALVEERARDLKAALHRESEARKDLRQFLSMMSHEFRTPLAIIDSAAQMLMLRADDLGEGASLRLGAIREGVSRLISLMDTCIADDRLDSLSFQLNGQRIDVMPLIQSAVTQQRVANPGRVITLRAAPLPPIFADGGLVGFVLNNLLGNALKFSPVGAEVELDAHPEATGIHISVSDRGIGVPSNEAPMIFDRFYRASNAAGVVGTGIGLNLSKRIVDVHGGTIDVTARRKGGSKFTVFLPYDRRASERG